MVHQAILCQKVLGFLPLDKTIHIPSVLDKLNTSPHEFLSKTTQTRKAPQATQAPPQTSKALQASIACVASVSVWFRSKERPRNCILGFGRARNETRVKKNESFSRGLRVF